MWCWLSPAGLGAPFPETQRSESPVRGTASGCQAAPKAWHVDQAFENGIEADRHKLIPVASLGENKPEPGSAGSLTGSGNLHGELSAQGPCPGQTAGAPL